MTFAGVVLKSCQEKFKTSNERRNISVNLYALMLLSTERKQLAADKYSDQQKS